MDGMPSLPSPVTSVTDQKKAPHGTPDSAQAFHSQGQDGPTLAILSPATAIHGWELEIQVCLGIEPGLLKKNLSSNHNPICTMQGAFSATCPVFVFECPAVAERHYHHVSGFKSTWFHADFTLNVKFPYQKCRSYSSCSIIFPSCSIMFILLTWQFPWFFHVVSICFIIFPRNSNGFFPSLPRRHGASIGPTKSSTFTETW